ncbi:MAG: [Lachnospiraceae bacterium]|nr:[FeFe] hydrogenase H-cluster maturation GTPase HydF [Lachnospiraceae bacterium]
MGLNDTQTAERIHIGFFGMRNAGKSSLVNRITNQEVSLVSDIKGTTTDPVKKSMELLPLGPVTIIDTPGFDDEGILGDMRVRKTKEVLSTCDIAVLVTDSNALSDAENALLSIIRQRGIPYLIVHNKTDLSKQKCSNTQTHFYLSAKHGTGIEDFKNALAASSGSHTKEIQFVADFITAGDLVILVTPIDGSAPKGRMILPQQQAIRDILDAGAISLVTQVETLPACLDRLKTPPALVITDSQAFAKVMNLVPGEIPLTSFSILMARYKGFLDEAVRGAAAIDRLPDHARVLISEGCTHHRQCEDIGTVKLPNWLKLHTGKELDIRFTSGHSFPDDLSAYNLIIHCGGCMLHDNELRNRMQQAVAAGTAFTNYGTAIAHMNGILERSIAPIYDR